MKFILTHFICRTNCTLEVVCPKCGTYKPNKLFKVQGRWRQGGAFITTYWFCDSCFEAQAKGDMADVVTKYMLTHDPETYITDTAFLLR